VTENTKLSIPLLEFVALMALVFSFGCLVSTFSTSFSGMQARQSYCLLCHLAQALFRSRDLLPITWILRRATRGFFLASPTRLGVSILSILL
jgi:hypothetical protein